MTEEMNRYELRNRYVFKGRLVMSTAFHIGTGDVRMIASSSDSPVVRTPEGVPFIPGSSFKGALRSTVEKLVPGLPGEWSSCGLVQFSKEAGWQAQQEAQKEGNQLCSTAWAADLADKKRRSPDPETAEEVRKELLDRRCDTCRLFGSPFAASHVSINDLYMSSKEWSEVVQVRDGVAIDRDSERAKDRLKYDFEAVPSMTVFDLEMTLENASPKDLQLLCVGLGEYLHGFGTIGGKRSRGLGACRLEGLQVYKLELTSIDETERNRRLRNYLLEKELEKQFSKEDDGEAFLNTYISQIFEGASR
jgi:CRISPR-associated RAMP protein (TIGR02581 family)